MFSDAQYLSCRLAISTNEATARAHIQAHVDRIRHQPVEQIDEFLSHVRSIIEGASGTMLSSEQILHCIEEFRRDSDVLIPRSRANS